MQGNESHPDEQIAKSTKKYYTIKWRKCIYIILAENGNLTKFVFGMRKAEIPFAYEKYD